jgi:hypothetical protein
MIMIRTQIQIEDAQIEWLRAKAKARGVSVSQLIREGVALFRANEERFPEEKKRRELACISAAGVQGLDSEEQQKERFVRHKGQTET